MQAEKQETHQRMQDLKEVLRFYRLLEYRQSECAPVVWNTDAAMNIMDRLIKPASVIAIMTSLVLNPKMRFFSTSLRGTIRFCVRLWNVDQDHMWHDRCPYDTN